MVGRMKKEAAQQSVPQYLDWDYLFELGDLSVSAVGAHGYSLGFRLRAFGTG
jgi:hypothetical protein